MFGVRAITLALVFTTPHLANALSIGAAAASEGGDEIAQGLPPDISVRRDLIDNGSFITPKLEIRYTGPLANHPGSVGVYIKINGRSATVDMPCFLGAVGRGDYRPECTLSLSASVSELFAGTHADQPWQVEFAFTDRRGHWHKDGDANFLVSFAAAHEAVYSRVLTGPIRLDYNSQTAGLEITYRPQTPGNPSNPYTVGSIDRANADSRGLYVGIISNGTPLPTMQIPLAPGGDVFRGSIDLSNISNGPMEIYFFDAKGNYDSRYGKNYSFTLRK